MFGNRTIASDIQIPLSNSRSLSHSMKKEEGGLIESAQKLEQARKQLDDTLNRSPVKNFTTPQKE